MALTVVVNNPNLPEGVEVAIDGLGSLVNGEPREFSDEEIAQFEAAHTVYRHTSRASGVVVKTKEITAAELIKNAPFVEIVKGGTSNA